MEKVFMTSYYDIIDRTSIIGLKFYASIHSHPSEFNIAGSTARLINEYLPKEFPLGFKFISGREKKNAEMNYNLTAKIVEDTDEEKILASVFLKVEECEVPKKVASSSGIRYMINKVNFLELSIINSVLLHFCIIDVLRRNLVLRSEKVRKAKSENEVYSALDDIEDLTYELGKLVKSASVYRRDDIDYTSFTDAE